MTLVIGTDEAGYGPNLGPLVVAATAWRTAAPVDGAEAVFEHVAAGAWNSSPRMWADSKTIHRGARGFEALERGVHAALELAGTPKIDHWPALVAALGAIGPGRQPTADWARLESLRLPAAAAADSCHAAAAAARTALATAEIVLVGIAARAIYPLEFNRLLATGLNKSDILSQATLELAAAVHGRHAAADTLVWCDRHGGRKAYAGLVGHHFSAPLVHALAETTARSTYAVPAARLRIEFSVGGESRLPVAIASMTAKYVRELAMQAFNAFWGERAAGLAPTAGYPVDARRWRDEAAAAIAREKIPPEGLWRRA